MVPDSIEPTITGVVTSGRRPGGACVELARLRQCLRRRRAGSCTRLILRGRGKNNLPKIAMSAPPELGDGLLTLKPAAFNASFCAWICATAQPSSFVRSIFWPNAAHANKAVSRKGRDCIEDGRRVGDQESGYADRYLYLHSRHCHMVLS